MKTWNDVSDIGWVDNEGVAMKTKEAEPERPEPRGVMALDRKHGERVRIDLGDGREVWITVKLLTLAGSQIAKLIIDAPRSVGADREEVYYRKVGINP